MNSIRMMVALKWLSHSENNTLMLQKLSGSGEDGNIMWIIEVLKKNKLKLKDNIRVDQNADEYGMFIKDINQEEMSA